MISATYPWHSRPFNLLCRVKPSELTLKRSRAVLLCALATHAGVSSASRCLYRTPALGVPSWPTLLDRVFRTGRLDCVHQGNDGRLSNSTRHDSLSARRVRTASSSCTARGSTAADSPSRTMRRVCGAGEDLLGCEFQSIQICVICLSPFVLGRPSSRPLPSTHTRLAPTAVWPTSQPETAPQHQPKHCHIWFYETWNFRSWFRLRRCQS